MTLLASRPSRKPESPLYCNYLSVLINFFVCKAFLPSSGSLGVYVVKNSIIS